MDCIFRARNIQLDTDEVHSSVRFFAVVNDLPVQFGNERNKLESTVFAPTSMATLQPCVIALLIVFSH